MKKGDLLLARFRKMTENLNTPSVLTQSSGSIEFGAKISLLAPHVPSKYTALLFSEHNIKILGTNTKFY